MNTLVVDLEQVITLLVSCEPTKDPNSASINKNGMIVKDVLLLGTIIVH
jgi:hypothetical protein